MSINFQAKPKVKLQSNTDIFAGSFANELTNLMNFQFAKRGPSSDKNNLVT